MSGEHAAIGERETLPPPADVEAAPAVALTRGAYVEQHMELAWDDAFEAYERAGRGAALRATAHHLEQAHDAGTRNEIDLRTAIDALWTEIKLLRATSERQDARITEQDRLIKTLQGELRDERQGRHRDIDQCRCGHLRYQHGANGCGETVGCDHEDCDDCPSWECLCEAFVLTEEDDPAT